MERLSDDPVPDSQAKTAGLVRLCTSSIDSYKSELVDSANVSVPERILSPTS